MRAFLVLITLSFASLVHGQSNTKAFPKVLAFPPYDITANEGISPDILDYIETSLAESDSIELIPFPLKKLMNVSYQQVFDKKYCKPVLEKVESDYIIMSKIDLINRTGKMSTDTWKFEIKLFDVEANTQKTILKNCCLKPAEIKAFILENIEVIENQIKQ